MLHTCTQLPPTVQFHFFSCTCDRDRLLYHHLRPLPTMVCFGMPAASSCELSSTHLAEPSSGERNFPQHFPRLAIPAQAVSTTHHFLVVVFSFNDFPWILQPYFCTFWLHHYLQSIWFVVGQATGYCSAFTPMTAAGFPIPTCSRHSSDSLKHTPSFQTGPTNGCALAGSGNQRELEPTEWHIFLPSLVPSHPRLQTDFYLGTIILIIWSAFTFQFSFWVPRAGLPIMFPWQQTFQL